MMFPNAVLGGIVAGRIDLAYRRWTRRMHAPGGRQRTTVGVIAFDAVEVVDPDSITEADAARTGSDLVTLRGWLERKPTGDLYRIELHFAGEDDRVALRDATPDPDDLNQLTTTLAAMDRRSRRGAWTRTFLALIKDHPG
ncbi:MAG: hypothetical protein L0G99_17935, partial [Propionibacteriales bacterium]|nr:hypothetical protein [Propionibacteriales bacterium]